MTYEKLAALKALFCWTLDKREMLPSDITDYSMVDNHDEGTTTLTVTVKTDPFGKYGGEVNDAIKRV